MKKLKASPKTKQKVKPNENLKGSLINQTKTKRKKNCIFTENERTTKDQSRAPYLSKDKRIQVQLNINKVYEVL